MRGLNSGGAGRRSRFAKKTGHKTVALACYYLLSSFKIVEIRGGYRGGRRLALEIGIRMYALRFPAVHADLDDEQESAGDEDRRRRSEDKHWVRRVVSHIPAGRCNTRPARSKPGVFN